MTKTIKRRRSFPICGYRIPVRYKDIGDDDYAAYSRLKRTIYCNTNPDAEWKEAHQFHEVLHAIFDLTGIHFLISNKLEEAIVEMLEAHLWPLVRFK